MHPSVVRHLTGPLYDRLRFRAGIAAAEAELSLTDRASREELDALVRARLGALLRHAAAHVPHYRAIPDDPDAFATLPLLGKEDLGPDLVARDRARAARVRRTSGSTGMPTSVLVDTVSLARHRAARRVAWGRLGFRHGDRWTMVWGRDEPRGLVYRAAVRAAENRQVLRIDDLEGDATERALDRVDRFDPVLLYGFASGLSRLAERRAGRGRPRSLRAVVSTAEMLPRADAERIASAFGVPVAHEYGLTEAQVVATSCEKGSLHAVEENVLLEVVRDGRPAAPGETGEIVVTDLSGYAAPRLRYRTGDTGAFVAGTCTCGRAQRRLDLRLARTAELFEVDGRLFHPEVFTLPHEFARFGDIRGFRVLRVGERAFEVRVVLADGTMAEPVLREFEAAIRVALPVDGLALRMLRVPRIERDRSGKLRYFEDVR